MQQDYEISKPKYQAIDFLLRYGLILSAVVGVIPLLAAIWLIVSGNFILGIICIPAAGFAYLIMRSYVELVAVIADMLLPK